MVEGREPVKQFCEKNEAYKVYLCASLLSQQLKKIFEVRKIVVNDLTPR